MMNIKLKYFSTLILGTLFILQGISTFGARNKAAIDQEISSSLSTLHSEQNRLTQLQDQMLQQSRTVAQLEAELKSQQLRWDAERSNRDFTLQQESNVLSQQLAGLQEQIQNQEQAVRMREQRLHGTIAPSDSDLVVGLQQEVQQAENQLSALRNQYSSLLAQQQALIQQNYTYENQTLQRQQAGQISLSVSLSQAQAQLQQLKQDDQRLTQEIANTRSKITDLRKEKSKAN